MSGAKKYMCSRFAYNNLHTVLENEVMLIDAAGSTLEAMALAVERSAVVLVCLSQGYKDSPSCRTGNLHTLTFIVAVYLFVSFFFFFSDKSRAVKLMRSVLKN